jgi:hypothetical protein
MALKRLNIICLIYLSSSSALYLMEKNYLIAGVAAIGITFNCLALDNWLEENENERTKI